MKKALGVAAWLILLSPLLAAQLQVDPSTRVFSVLNSTGQTAGAKLTDAIETCQATYTVCHVTMSGIKDSPQNRTFATDPFVGIGTNPVIVEGIESTYTLSDNVTVPANVMLRAAQGGILCPASAKTLTINGPVEFDDSPHFCTGAGTVAYGPLVPSITAEWHGFSPGNTGAQNLTALQAAVTAAAGHTLRFASTGGAVANITGTVNLFNSNIKVVGNGTALKLVESGTAYTDLVIDAATDTDMTSVAHPFGAGDVGRALAITSGTGFTVQTVKILSVVGAVATASASLGTLGSTGGNAVSTMPIPLFKVGNGTDAIENVTIDGVYLYGPGIWVDGTDTGMHGIRIEKATNVHVENSVIKNFGSSAIWIVYVDQFWATNNTLEGTWAINSCTIAGPLGCFVQGASGRGEIGIAVGTFGQDSSGIHIEGNEVSHAQFGVIGGADPTGAGGGNVATDYIITANNVHDIEGQHCYYVEGQNLIISGNTCARPYYDGIKVVAQPKSPASTQSWAITGNTILGPHGPEGGNGITLGTNALAENPLNSVVISANSFTDANGINGVGTVNGKMCGVLIDANVFFNVLANAVKLGDWMCSVTASNNLVYGSAQYGFLVFSRDEPWSPAHAYSLGDTALDPGQHVQKVITAGTSGTPDPPAWNDTDGTTLTVTGASTATPISITTSAPHGLLTNASVHITGVLGIPEANGYWIITSTGASTFTLNGSVGAGTYTSGGTVATHGTTNDGTGTLVWEDQGLSMDRINLENNHCYNCGGGDYYPISYQAGLNGHIANNELVDTRSGASRPNYGIRVSADPAATLRLDNNYVRGTITNNVRLEATVQSAMDNDFNNSVFDPATLPPRLIQQQVRVQGDLSTLPTSGFYGQLEVTGAGSNAAERLVLAYMTTGDYAVIQAVHNGTGLTNLVLEPSGGNVIAGNTSSLDSGFYVDYGYNDAKHISVAFDNHIAAASTFNQSDNTDLYVFGSYNAALAEHTSGTKTKVAAVEGDGIVNGAGGTTSELYGVTGYVEADAGHVVQAAALYAQTCVNGGATLDNCYGLLVQNQTGHAIKTGTGLVEIGDQLKSNVVTGTAPFIVASTTKVENLNAALIDGVALSGFMLSTTPGTSGTDINVVAGVLQVPDASATARGVVTTGTQTIAGAKTFTGALISSGAIESTNGSTAPVKAVIPSYGPYAVQINNTTFGSTAATAFGLYQSDAGVAGLANNNATAMTIATNGAISVPLPLTSSVATGTAPFSIASTTEVANLRSATATALFADGADCASGASAGGVSTTGAAQNCVVLHTLLTANCTGTLPPSATISFDGFGGDSAACAAPTGGGSNMPVPTGTIKNLKVVAGIAGVNASSGLVRVYDASAVARLSCTLGTGTYCTDTSSYTLGAASPTQVLFISITSQAAETLAGVSISFELWY